MTFYYIRDNLDGMWYTIEGWGHLTHVAAPFLYSDEEVAKRKLSSLRGGTNDGKRYYDRETKTASRKETETTIERFSVVPIELNLMEQL